MLQAIRNRASSLVVKILFGALIVSFGVWGIGDIFRNHAVETTVATVGDRKIDAQELNQVVRRQAEQLRAALHGADMDPEQLKQLGIVDSSLQQLINGDLVDLEVKHLGLAIGNATVRDAIMSNRAFYNSAGQFDPNLYRQLLAGQQMTEPQFESQLRTELARAQLDTAVASGAVAPPQLVDMLYRTRAEQRTAEVVALPASAVPAPGKPSDAELDAFYKKHQDDFRVPELRSFTLGLLTVDEVASRISVPEDKLKSAYQDRLAEFHTPEQRHLQQILLSTEAKAKAAEAQLVSGKAFAEVAKTVAGETPDTLDLGFFTKEDLPPDLGKAAFSLKVDQTTPPIHDTLGWHILRVTEIKPATTQPFEAVKARLAAEVAHDMAGNTISDTANKIDDALAGGANFAEVAKKFDLKQEKFEKIDARGKDADGKPADLPKGGAGILKTAFATPSGQTSQLDDLGDSGYYLLTVDKVAPPAVRPLDEVRAKAIEMWQSDQRDAALAALAKQITAEVKGGKSLADAAKAHKLDAFASGQLQRTGGDAKVPPTIVAKLFGAKKGETVSGKNGDGYVVAQVTAVEPGDPAKDKDAVKQLADELAPSLQQDLLQEYTEALRKRYPVTIDQAAVARVF